MLSILPASQSKSFTSSFTHNTSSDSVSVSSSESFNANDSNTSSKRSTIIPARVAASRRIAPPRRARYHGHSFENFEQRAPASTGFAVAFTTPILPMTSQPLCSRALLAAASLAAVLHAAAAHSHMAKPLATRELHCRVGAQQGRDCYGPCPRMDDYGRVNHPISANHPAETWARGSFVRIRWHRDNHDGTGFVRLALVPVDKMMDKDAHTKYAFHFTCMNKGPHHCPDRSYDACGNDEEGMAWETFARVPTSYPDGVYVLGWSWYGGGDYRGQSFFGDYYSCSFVRIHGGSAVTHDFRPEFDAQNCQSATDRLGVCWKEPCHHGGPVRTMIPAEFNGRTPDPIRRTDLEHDMGMPTGSASGSSTFVSTSGSSVSLGGRKPSTSGSSGSSSGGSGSSVSLGARGRNEEMRDTRATGNSGGLGVFFLDFRTWNKVPIDDGGRYRLADFPNGLTVEAFYEGRIRYIEFIVDGRSIRKEKNKPFVMNGNRNNHFFGWMVPTGRTVKLQVVVVKHNEPNVRFEADVWFD